MTKFFLMQGVSVTNGYSAKNLASNIKESYCSAQESCERAIYLKINSYREHNQICDLFEINNDVCTGYEISLKKLLSSRNNCEYEKKDCALAAQAVEMLDNPTDVFRSYVPIEGFSDNVEHYNDVQHMFLSSGLKCDRWIAYKALEGGADVNGIDEANQTLLMRLTKEPTTNCSLESSNELTTFLLEQGDFSYIIARENDIVNYIAEE
jgi:hypothetical protein